MPRLTTLCCPRHHYRRAVQVLTHLTPEGGGYHAEREELLSGAGLPLTDLIIGKDGAMYFLTGGRRTESALWRVTYTGSESTAPAEKSPPHSGEIANGVDQDHKLLQAVATSSSLGDVSQEKLDLLWSQTGSADRLQRYSARLVLEQIPITAWISRLNAEPNPWRIITAAIATARAGTPEQSAVALSALDRVQWQKLDS